MLAFFENYYYAICNLIGQEHILAYHLKIHVINDKDNLFSVKIHFISLLIISPPRPNQPNSLLEV